MLRPYIFRSAPTFTERMLSLRPAARPSAAVTVVPAPAPLPPVARSRPAAAVTTAWRTRGTPPTAATTPLRSYPPGVTIAAPAAAPAPTAPATRAPPIGLARRGLRAVWTVAAIAHPTTVSHRERHSIAAVPLHRVALAHGRRVGAPPGDQRAVGDAEPRAYPARCGVGAEPVLEVHLHARAVAYAVDEQVARTVGERVPTAVERPIPIPVESVAVKSVAVGPVENRIVAQERIVKERIVARAVQRRVAVAIRPAPAVAEIHRVVGIVRVIVRPRRRDRVCDGVVVEMAIGRHALHHVDQRGFLVVAPLARVEHAVVPMITAHELVELERRAGPGCEHQPRALAVVHEERFAVAPAAHFDGLVAPHEVVVRRVEREQHPHAPLGVGAQHEHIAVLGQPHIDPGLVGALEIVVVIEPDFDRWIVGRGNGERKQQWKHHGAILYIPSPANG